ncbi:hypothetical protein ACIQI7_36440 [Kitasatospora sp. NPDC092039]|uniref:hypothetical protein n=1 Tax=Kitasatospora sp. NPDC092039 TaxID=3364086 RepID=UPI0037FE334C
MTDGEWWRKSGPWSERSGGGPGSGSGERASEGAAEVPSAPAPVPDPDPDSVYDPPAPSAAGIPSVPLDLPDLAEARERADAIPPPTVSSTGPWTMTLFDFSDGPRPAPKPIPEQRTAEQPSAEEAAAPAGPADPKKKPRRGRRKQAPAPAAPPAQPGAAAGKAGGRKGKGKAKAKGKEAEQGAPARKPSPLILLSCGLLVGGAVSGFFPAMLAGWGLGYLSRQISDLMRKFVVLGIPLATMSATTLFSMRQAKQAGGQGGGLQSGSPLGQISWSAAPDVLRVSAVLSAVVLLLLAMRRRPPQQG